MNICKKRSKQILWRAFCAVLFDIPLIFSLDLILAHLENELYVREFALIAVFILALSVAVAEFAPALSRILSHCLCILYALAAAIFIFWLAFYLTAAYKAESDNDKSSLFANKSLMLIVPHEDDDLNLLGGVIEEYCKYNSTLRVVFTTNGDYHGREIGEKRIREAIKVLTELGLPEDNIIFLGYSDNMQTDDGYFYDSDKRAHSVSGDADCTYAIPEHPPYAEGREYSRSNFSSDLKSCILQYRPEILICVDNDYHIDHAAAHFTFEDVLSKILKSEPDYRPYVLNGFAYSTAYYSLSDFYDSLNLASTALSAPAEIIDENSSFLWSKRLRLPVSAEGLSRSMAGCRLWKSISDYVRTDAFLSAKSIINSDKVFWSRSTDSVLYTAMLTASSGDPSVLNDYRLVYRDKLETYDGLCGIWQPDGADVSPYIDVRLSEPTDIRLLRLYDAPSSDDNILALSIEFNNGSCYELGPLPPNGSSYDFYVEESNVSSFRITVEEYEGSSFGLTEIEAFSELPQAPFSFIKLTDKDENFVYDMLVEDSDTELRLYSFPELQFTEDNISISCSNEKCSAETAEGSILVHIPKGEAAYVSVRVNDTALSDTVYIRCGSTGFSRLGMQLEESIYNYIAPVYTKTVLSKLLLIIHDHI